MQTPATDFWWAFGIGTLVLLTLTAAFLVTLVVSQRKMRSQLSLIKASETKYRALFENSLVGMIRIAIPGFHVVDSNRTFLELMGKASIESVRDCFCSAGPVDLRWLEMSLLRKGSLEDAELQLQIGRAHV